MKIQSLLGCFGRGAILDEAVPNNRRATRGTLSTTQAANKADAKKVGTLLQPPAAQPAPKATAASHLDACVRAWEHELTDPVSFELLTSAVRFQCGHATNAESAAQWRQASDNGGNCAECGQLAADPKADPELCWRAETFETFFPNGWSRAPDAVKWKFLGVMGTDLPPTNLHYKKPEDPTSTQASQGAAAPSGLRGSDGSAGGAFLLDSYRGPELTKTYDGDPTVRLQGARALVGLLGATAYPRIRAMASDDPCPITRVELQSLLERLDRAARQAERLTTP